MRENFIKLRDFILDEMVAFHKKKTRCNGYTVKAAKKVLTYSIKEKKVHFSNTLHDFHGSDFHSRAYISDIPKHAHTNYTLLVLYSML